MERGVVRYRNRSAAGYGNTIGCERALERAALNNRRDREKKRTGLHRFHRLMKKKWFRQRMGKLALVWASIIFALSLGMFLLFGNKADAQEESEEVYYKYYRYEKVMEGDTLWSYAEKYRKPDGMTCSEYVEEVRSINHLDGDYIREGDKIVLPYYSTVYVCSR